MFDKIFFLYGILITVFPIISALFTCWFIACIATSILKPITDSCDAQWNIDNFVVMEKAFCPVDSTTER